MKPRNVKQQRTEEKATPSDTRGSYEPKHTKKKHRQSETEKLAQQGAPKFNDFSSREEKKIQYYIDLINKQQRRSQQNQGDPSSKAVAAVSAGCAAKVAKPQRQQSCEKPQGGTIRGLIHS
eukprot:GHVN01019156.1.p2 GENE.GHVN01019156.1~~GHVN01019156.1.p2  ORF type:complete len:121 (+),score=24.78 GHVN01019156.1:30-392(+)